MSFKNVFAGLIMLLCVTTVGCDLNITPFRIEKARKFEWVYYSINGRERGVKVLPPTFAYMHEAEKMCRDHGAHLASIHSKEENDFIYGLIEAAFLNKRRHDFGDFILLGFTLPQPEPKWTDNSPMDFKMFKGDYGTENIYCGLWHPNPKEICSFLYMGNITGFANAWCYSWCGNLAVRNMRVFGVCTTA